MATEKQIAANRRNAAKSTGPRTQEGKARSRMNALRHGLAAAPAVDASQSALAIFERLHQIDNKVLELFASKEAIEQLADVHLEIAVRRLAAIQRYGTSTYSQLKKEIKNRRS
jgi:hypothetical protein